jgi:hypothetical protein
MVLPLNERPACIPYLYCNPSQLCSIRNDLTDEELLSQFYEKKKQKNVTV